ncbi:hypothetical protein D9756_004830 [Leucocoprinus leucothites]|uniref:Uncharacterized protein n=1 Tax=Leucocoprinus leucothites TaxID=201217 RepID=A0A8H5G9X8_9AGAR|nr:hypothetical protein D9756_004830 [Leucoagaricus leucothites]
MSRGDRAAVTGILSTSMRDNYGEHGVAEYYRKVGSTYRNPHYPGIRLCIFAWLHKWWSNESSEIAAQGPCADVLLFDMACGRYDPHPRIRSPRSIIINHYHIRLTSAASTEQFKAGNRTTTVDARPSSFNTTALVTLSRKLQTYCTIPLGPLFPTPLVVASDPFTCVAYKHRTSLPCATFSFNDIAEGNLPPFTSDISKIQIQAQPQDLRDPHAQKQVEIKEPIPNDETITIVEAGSEEKGLTSLTPSARQEPYSTIEMVVCSFALHLIETPSALFALMYALSYKARWLVVLAPHKKPEIKDGWGWRKWNVEEWRNTSMSGHNGELLFDRQSAL